jgi:hypothetical protein
MMLSEAIRMDPSNVMTVASIVVASTTSAAGLGWWLAGRFRDIESNIEVRHEQYLERFRRISVALAELGHRNGDPA